MCYTFNEFAMLFGVPSWMNVFFVALFFSFTNTLRANWEPEDTHILTWILKPKERQAIKQVWRQCWTEVYHLDAAVLDYIEEHKELPPNYVAIANIDPWCVQACQYKKLGLWDEKGHMPNEQAFYEYNKKIAHVPAQLMLKGLTESLTTSSLNVSKKSIELLENIRDLTQIVSKEVNYYCSKTDKIDICAKAREYLDCYFFTMIRSRHYLLAKAQTPRMDPNKSSTAYEEDENIILKHKWELVSKEKLPPELPAEIKREIDSWAKTNLLKYFDLIRKPNYGRKKYGTNNNSIT